MNEYPLDQLVAIKQKRLEEAEKVLAEKKNILAHEEQKLAALEKKRDAVKEHYKAKLAQLREKLDVGTGTEKIQQMKQYLKLVSEELKVEQQKVEAQMKVVASAQVQVDLARQDLFKKQKDVEKLKIHHKEWQKEAHRIEEQKEAVFNDESGSTMHTMKKAEKKRRNHRRNNG